MQKTIWNTDRSPKSTLHFFFSPIILFVLESSDDTLHAKMHNVVNEGRNWRKGKNRIRQGLSVSFRQQPGVHCCRIHNKYMRREIRRYCPPNYIILSLPSCARFLWLREEHLSSLRLCVINLDSGDIFLDRCEQTSMTLINTNLELNTWYEESIWKKGGNILKHKLRRTWEKKV